MKNRSLFVVLVFSIIILIVFPTLPPPSSSSVVTKNLSSPSKICSDLDAPLAKNPESVRLIVQFRDGPTPTDQGFIEGLGFSIQRTFHIVPALSVYGPTAALDDLLASDRVVFVEHNDPVAGFRGDIR